VAQLRSAAESGGRVVYGAGAAGIFDCEIEAERALQHGRDGELDRGVPGRSVVADAVEVSAVRKYFLQPAVDAALHQLWTEQG